MSKVWEFFENMNEAVYASDVDTYELIYLNKAARKSVPFLRIRTAYKVKNATKPCSNALSHAQCVPITA